MTRRITKSAFLSGVQCLKRLYISEHLESLNIYRDPLPKFASYLMEMGNYVGSLARTYFDDRGVVCYNSRVQESALVTESFLESENVLYEASFQTPHMFVAVDILKRVPSESNARNDEWDAFEVKSSTSVSDHHVLDAAIQYWTMRQCGLKIRTMNIMHINRDYVRHGELNIKDLFVIKDVTQRVVDMQHAIEQQVAIQTDCVSSESMPPTVRKIRVNSHCSSPHVCPFRSHCNEEAGVSLEDSSSILHLSNAGGKQWELLHHHHVRSLVDIPASVKLTRLQQIQVNAEISQSPHVDIMEVRKFLESLEYPLFYLDFEAINPAVPLFDNTYPYQQVCFQYSLHMQDAPFSCTAAVDNILDNKGGSIRHFEFLADGTQTDPRRAFATNLLIDLNLLPRQCPISIPPGVLEGNSLEHHVSRTASEYVGVDNDHNKSAGTVDFGRGNIVVYNKSFESARLLELARLFPDLAPYLTAVEARLVDLMSLFRQRHVYYPAMKGKYSLKSVLPALVPTLATDLSPATASCLTPDDTCGKKLGNQRSNDSKRGSVSVAARQGGYTTLQVSDGMQASALYTFMVNGKYDHDTIGDISGSTCSENDDNTNSPATTTEKCGNGASSSVLLSENEKVVAVPRGAKEQARTDLKAYCKLDTWAMVLIMHKLSHLYQGGN